MSLVVTDLDVRYGAVRALRRVSLTAEDGRTTALLGANGAGKTTLLRTVAGLHRPAGGRVLLDGADITGRPAHDLARRGLGLVPEGRQLFGDLTVAENLRMGLHGLRVRGHAVGERIDEATALFPALDEAMDRRAGLLSGGQQQMVAIARALVRRPRVLLLDEPSLGLAPRLVTDILTTIGRLADSGVTVLLAEQNATATLRCAHHGAVLRTGELVLDGPAAGLLADDEVGRQYLGGGGSSNGPVDATSPSPLPAVLRGPLLSP